MKRRLKSEMTSNKKRSVEFTNTVLKSKNKSGGRLSQTTVAAQTSSDNTLNLMEDAASKEFEDSLMKLA